MKTSYMCGTSWAFELDPDNGGPIRVFSSIEALKADSECWKECGIVRIEMELAEVEYCELVEDIKHPVMEYGIKNEEVDT